MGCDVSIVLYRQVPPEFAALLRDLERQQVGTLWLLVSQLSTADCAWIERRTESAPLRVRTEWRSDNLGFAGGHNRMLRRAFAAGADEVFVLNPDVRIRGRSLSEFLSSVEAFGRSGSVHAPRLLQEGGAPGLDRVDTDGIVWTRDRRHFDKGQGSRPLPMAEPARVCGVSGAAVLVPRDVWTGVTAVSGHFFDPLYLAYREDAELGLRLTALGYGSYIHPSEGIRHVRTGANGRAVSESERFLQVQNRVFLRYGLVFRFGWEAWVRDGLVLLASVADRSRRSGLMQGLRLRRTMKYRRRRVVSVINRSRMDGSSA